MGNAAREPGVSLSSRKSLSTNGADALADSLGRFDKAADRRVRVVALVPSEGRRFCRFRQKTKVVRKSGGHVKRAGRIQGGIAMLGSEGPHADVGVQQSWTHKSITFRTALGPTESGGPLTVTMTTILPSGARRAASLLSLACRNPRDTAGASYILVR